MCEIVLHLLGSAAIEGTGIARIVLNLAQHSQRNQHHACFLHGGGPLVAFLQNGTGSTSVINLHNKWLGLWQLFRLLRQLKPAIVQQHAGGPRLTQLLRWMTSARLVVHVHSTTEEATMTTTAPVLSSAVDACIANSEYTAQFIKHTRCRVIYAGVATLTLPRIAGPGKTLLVVGAAGRLVEVKGFIHLIRAFAGLTGSFPDARLEICGEGPLLEVLQQEIRRLDCTTAITLKGWCSDFPQYVRRWDIFVQPSLREAFGLSLLEAMAAGLPVIASNVGGIPELVENNVNGLLTEPADVEALSNALAAILIDEALRNRLGSAAIHRIANNFSTGKMCEEMSTFYEDLLTGQP